MKKLILAMAVAMLGACGSDDDDAGGPVDTGDTAGSALLSGIQSSAAVGSVAETMGNLESALNAVDAISIVAQIDHEANAANNDLVLRPTRVTLFGNPRLGTPLMQVNQVAGLDLPQKMFAWTDAEGQSNVAFNSASYLSGRHGLEAADTALTAIDGALANFAAVAAGQEFVTSEVSAPANGEGIITVVSANDMDTTYNTLRDNIEASPLTLIAQVDHGANAASVDLDLRPTRLIIFGNPNLGTPLMQSGQSIGIDLPQKMLVFEDADGQVSIAYNDPAYLAQRHGITDQQDRIDTITGALRTQADNAATAQ